MKQRPFDECLETVMRLAFVAECRDADSRFHLKRVSLLARVVGEALSLDTEDLDHLMLAAPMHDIGKVVIPDDVLLKPGALSEAERLMMQDHTGVGARLLAGAESPIVQLGEVICRTHHERYDGRGYPNQLAGEDIPLAGRIVAVVDVYDALTTRRVYKPASPPDEAIRIMRGERDGHFDGRVLDAFFGAQDKVFEVYEEYAEEDEGEWLI